jgi:hypothetical protein
MVSMLEDMLLRYSNGEARLRNLVLKCLDDYSLRNLRLISRLLHDLLNRYSDRMFGQLFLPAPWSYHTDSSSLNAVAPFCRVLRIKLGLEKAHTEHKIRRFLQNQRPTEKSLTVDDNISARERWRNVRHALAISSRRSSPSSATTSIDRSSATTRTTISSNQPPSSSKISATSAKHVWIAFLSKCEKLQSITISANGEPGWPGKTQVEDDLVDLRVALEGVQLPHVRCVRLTPIHAMGIVHMRWSGFGAFDAVSANSCHIWSNLHTLDLQLENPFLPKHKLSEWQQVMFKKILYDYLLSFAATLKCLRFIWRGEDGPSPMTLDLEPGLEGCRQAIVWSALEGVYLGNILLPYRTIRLLPERVTKAGVCLKTLRSTHRHSRVNFEDENAWVQVLLGSAPHGIERKKVSSHASSVYSQ